MRRALEHPAFDGAAARLVGLVVQPDSTVHRLEVDELSRARSAQVLLEVGQGRNVEPVFARAFLEVV